MTNRARYGDGSVYQRASDGRWIGTLEAGFTEDGRRRRVTVSAKTERLCKAKLREKREEVAADGVPAKPLNVTVKTWANEWLAIKQGELRPKAYNAAASPVRKWIVPTIGHVRLAGLSPAHVRAVAAAQRAAQPPLKATTIAATQRTLFNMLRAARAEGYRVPETVTLVKMPKVLKSDRTAIPADEALAMLVVASELGLPHVTRWAVALVQGMRQGECLGLTWDAIDFDRGIMRCEWQLQALPYIDRKDKALGFRLPHEFEARHLVDAYHLVRPKSKDGVREFPIIDWMRPALLAWREIAPPNPWGLVWPTIDGRPANNKHDLLEWHALQGTTCIGHPGGRYYHVHEARNVAATQMSEANASPIVTTSLLGHSTIAVSESYMVAQMDAKRAVLEAVGARLLPPSTTPYEASR